MSAVHTSVFNALKRFTSCDIGDALVKLNIRHGGYLHGLKMFSPYQQASTRKISGPVFPVKMVDADDKSAPKPSQHSADAVKKDSVVFVLQPANYFAACWGGLMSTRAKYLDAQGVVIDGSFRDVNEHRDLEFSLFARGTSALDSTTFTTSAALEVPVQFTSLEQSRPIQLTIESICPIIQG
ncbi:RraA-like protein [Aureobasidium sp. EXF-3400]|nr:RraA-like protein [Aureobasidium sp. EXF-12344]KAI4783318.1 RraA-like protein [Aureobasidium sp. EXF-3400]